MYVHVLYEMKFTCFQLKTLENMRNSEVASVKFNVMRTCTNDN
jgi:hypothetical protein